MHELAVGRIEEVDRVLGLRDTGQELAVAREDEGLDLCGQLEAVGHDATAGAHEPIYDLDQPAAWNATDLGAFGLGAYLFDDADEQPPFVEDRVARFVAAGGGEGDHESFVVTLGG